MIPPLKKSPIEASFLKRAADKQSQTDRAAQAGVDALKATPKESLLGLFEPVLKQIADAARISKQEILDALKEFKTDSRPINVSVPAINVPEIKIPTITIPPIEFPEQKPPIVNVPAPQVHIPNIMKVLIEGVSREDPLPVILMGQNGKPMQFPVITYSGGGGRGDFFTIVDIRSSTSSLIDQTENALRVTGNFSTSTLPDATSTTAPSGSNSTAYEASRGVVKASAGQVYTITGYNSSASALFIHIYNAASQPAEGAIPIVVFKVPGDSDFSYSPGEKFGKYFSTGIVVLSSITGPTKTLNSSADCWFNIEFK